MTGRISCKCCSIWADSQIMLRAKGQPLIFVGDSVLNTWHVYIQHWNTWAHHASKSLNAGLLYCCTGSFTEVKDPTLCTSSTTTFKEMNYWISSLSQQGCSTSLLLLQIATFSLGYSGLCNKMLAWNVSEIMPITCLFHGEATGTNYRGEKIIFNWYICK